MVNDSLFIQLAIKEAHKSDHKSFRHGAVLIMGKKVIAKGHNKLQYNNGFPFKSVHAEMDTIWTAKTKYNKLDRCKMYVVRVRNNGNLGLSKPCVHCSNLIKKYKIKDTYFSTEYIET